jgi:hypothetical protein
MSGLRQKSLADALVDLDGACGLVLGQPERADAGD